MRIPVIVLVRGGSKRLPNKWRLKWEREDGTQTTLLRNCIERIAGCPYVSRIIVASDHHEILSHASVTGVDVCARPEVEDDQSSIEGLRWVQEALGLEASFVLLSQATSPFVNPDDISRLVEEWRTDPSMNYHLVDGRTMYPSGMGYIVHPFAEGCTGFMVPQYAHPIDIDTMADYTEALKIRREGREYDWPLEDTE